MFNLPQPTLSKSGKTFRANPVFKKFGFVSFLLLFLLSNFIVEVAQPGQNDLLPIAAASPPGWEHLQLILLACVFIFGWMATRMDASRTKRKVPKYGHHNTPYPAHKLREPLTHIFAHLEDSLEKLDKSDHEDIVVNLVAIRDKCKRLSQLLDEAQGHELTFDRFLSNGAYLSSETGAHFAANGSIALLEKSNGHEPASPEQQYGLNLVRKVMEQVHLNADNTDFNVEMLCRKVGMSYSQLHRKITVLSGKTPNQLIREVRLDRAKELLQDYGIHISDVAFQSGYNDPSYFSRIFTKETGMTPSEFREKC